jgi:hypothetical protein
MAKKKIIQVPKGYLSFSQVSLWESSPSQYKKLYFDGDKRYGITNSGMEFGSRVADALEHGKQTGDLLTDTAMELLPKYDIQDKEITATIKTPSGSVDILGKPDSMDSKTFDFFEFKTGKVAWTQAKADKHLQLKFYATLIYLKYMVVPKNIELIWMETHNDDGVYTPTGRIERFKVEIKLVDIVDTMALISRVAKEIEAEWVVYEPPPEDEF